MALAQRGSDRGCSTGLGKGQEADLGEEAQLWRPRPVLSKGETINKLQRDHFLCEKRLFQKHRVNAGFPDCQHQSAWRVTAEHGAVWSGGTWSVNLTKSFCFHHWQLLRKAQLRTSPESLGPWLSRSLRRGVTNPGRGSGLSLAGTCPLLSSPPASVMY